MKTDEKPTWLPQPTADGYWLIYDSWSRRPGLVLISNFGKANQSISCMRTGGRVGIRIPNMRQLRNAKWQGPIAPPED